MPLYQLQCGHEAILRWSPDADLACPECGTQTKRLPHVGRPIGLNPVVFDQRSGAKGAFANAAEVRAYEAKHPDRVVVSRDSPEMRHHRDSALEAADKTAKSVGFRDFDHMRHAKRK